MKILFVQPPRKYWPFLNEEDNFILPLWMPLLGAIAREQGHQVLCIDCMVEHIGWKSLQNLLIKEQPDLVAISESHSLYINEATRFIKLCKELLPKAKIIAGGGHVVSMAKELLIDYPIDYIFIGEGEHTFKEFLIALDSKSSIDTIQGLAFLKNERFFETPPRPLESNLDSFPTPAWDLVKMDEYGKSKYLFSPGGITVYHSRGCNSSCNFCSWWVQMAERSFNGEKIELKPKWRTRSAKNVVDELQYLKERYGKSCFIFIDGTWNLDSKWNLAFSNEVINRKLNIEWFAFMRGDYLLRDEKFGILEVMVKAGLRHICIGMEHSEQIILNAFEKKNYKPAAGEEIAQLFKKKYPQVFLQATFIIGGPHENHQTLKSLKQYINKLDLDFPAVHILTPVPGTKAYEVAKRDGKIEITDFTKYDWNTPIMRTDHLSRDELAYEAYKLYRSNAKFFKLIRGLFSPHAYKRKLHIWFWIVSFRVLMRNMKDAVFHPKEVIRLVTPDWYEK